MITPYSEQYIESLFQKWYASGCPSIPEFYKNIVPDELNRVPHQDQVRRWASDYRWRERKDEIMGKAAVVMEENLVKQTIEMWKRHADAAQEVAFLALDYIRIKGFDSSSSAVKAIEWAQEEERRTRGAEALIESIKQESNEDLIETIRNLASRKLSTDDDDAIDVTGVDIEDKSDQDAKGSA